MFRTSCKLLRLVATGLDCQGCSARFISSSPQQSYSPSDVALGRGDRKTKRGKRFAASTGVYRPKQEAVRRQRLRFMDPTGLKRMTLPHIACLHSNWEDDDVYKPVFFEGEGQIEDGDGTESLQQLDHSDSITLQSSGVPAS